MIKLHLRNDVLRTNIQFRTKRGKITMSYNSRFIFATVPFKFVSDEKKWCKVFAEFKLSGFNDSPKCFNKESEYFFYSYDG